MADEPSELEQPLYDLLFRARKPESVPEPLRRDFRLLNSCIENLRHHYFGDDGEITSSKFSPDVLWEAAEVVTLSLAHLKKLGITRLEAHPLMQQKYREATALLRECSQPHWEALYLYSPITAVETIKKMAMRNAFVLAGDRDLSQNFGIALGSSHNMSLDQRPSHQAAFLVLAGRFLPLDDLRKSRDLTSQVINQLFFNPVNRRYYDAASASAASSQEKLDWYRAIISTYFKAYKIGTDFDVVPLDGTKDVPGGAGHTYVEGEDGRGRHVFVVDDIDSMTAGMCLLAAAHEVMHGVQKHQRLNPDYIIPETDDRIEMFEGDIRGTIVPAKRRSEIVEPFAMLVGGEERQIDHGNDNIARHVFGDDGAHFYQGLADERQAQANAIDAILQYWSNHESTPEAEKHKDWCAREYERILASDLNQADFIPPTEEIRALLYQFEHIILPQRPLELEVPRSTESQPRS